MTPPRQLAQLNQSEWDNLVNTSARRQGRNQLRIIGGKWRGRKLDFPSVAGLRPTGDRIRETLFNWLAAHVAGAHCLDLFAGSGALGLEALSRDAAKALLLDNNPEVVRQLKANGERLKADNLQVTQASALDWLENHRGTSFDLVFLDPPFQSDLLAPAVESLNSGDHLRDQALIYLESARDQAFSLPGSWQLHRQKFAGQVNYALYRYQAPSS